MTRSIRWRLTASVVGTIAAILVALAAILFVVVHRTAWSQHDAALASRARAIAASAEHDDTGYEMPEPRGEPGTYVEVWRRDGTILMRTSSLGETALPREAAGDGEPVFRDLTLPDGRSGRAVALRFVPHDEAHGAKAEPLTLVLAEGTESVDAASANVRTWFLLFGAAALVAIALITSTLLERGLRPLSRLATRLEAIDDRQLTTRLSVENQPTELVVPVRKLNELLERLERSFARERQFTADVSHELRTPLAGLRTLLEVTALSERSVDDYRAALASALQITTTLAALAENLLMLARLDDGELPVRSDIVNLHELVDECWRPHETIATERGLRFTNAISPAATAQTDREKLRIVIGNLLSNAAEYTESGGWIEIASPEGALLAVADSGPAIPDDQLERIFDRMWRGDASRTASGVHCGIGLSLARALCAHLSLSLIATSSSDRVCFRVCRP